MVDVATYAGIFSEQLLLLGKTVHIRINCSVLFVSKLSIDLMFESQVIRF